MKKFKFGLAPLLKVKEQRERLAEARVAQTRQDVETCRGHLDRLQEALAAVAAQMERLLGTAQSVEAWAATFDQSSRLERAIRDGESALRRAEKIMRHAIAERTRISTEVEALETLREEHLRDYRQDLQRAEQDRLDEVVMRQWMQARRKGPGI